MCAIGKIWFPIRWRGIFQRLPQDGVQAEITENVRVSPFNKGLAVDTTFSQIHLDGQYTFRMGGTKKTPLPYSLESAKISRPALVPWFILEPPYNHPRLLRAHFLLKGEYSKYLYEHYYII